MSNKYQPFKDQKIINGELPFQVGYQELANDVLHRSIGALTCVNYSRWKQTGSGFLISKNLVLTVAHNVYDLQRQNRFQDFKFYLVKNGVAGAYYEIEDIKYLQEFQFQSSKDRLTFNFALLKLNRQVEFSNNYGKMLNYSSIRNKLLQFYIPCQTCLLNNNSSNYLQLFGFPVIRDNYRPLDPYDHEFILNQYGLSRRNRITSIDSSKYKIGYAISTVAGYSGCPVTINNNIIAIHVCGLNEFNIGRLIDLNLLTKLKDWCKELNAHPFKISQELCNHLQPIRKQLQQLNKQLKLLNKIHQTNLSFQSLSQINLQDYPDYQYLNLQSNKISQIDLTKNINLTHLNMRSNKLGQINLLQNAKLAQADLTKNSILKINITKNINLTHLSLASNQLSEIILNKNTVLIYLDISFNKVQKLDLSNNPQLIHLNVQSNNLSLINVDRNINLKYLNANSNKLKAIQVINNKNLTDLHLNHNYISQIDLGKNINLKNLYIGFNKLEEIDVSSNRQLTNLSLPNNKLSLVDFSPNKALVNLVMSCNYLFRIDLTQNGNLTLLNLQKNKLSRISLRLCPDMLLGEQISSGFEFSGQEAEECNIQINCKQFESNKCELLKKKLIQKYREYENKHFDEVLCQPIFSIKKI